MFWWERVKNYRTFKVYDWKGQPDYPPVAKTKDGKVYVSWNGATDVRYWRLHGFYLDERGEIANEEAETNEKDGFESAFTVSGISKYDYFKVEALDGQMNTLAISVKAEEVDKEELSPGSVFAALMGAGSVIALCVWFFLLRQRTVPNSGGYSPLKQHDTNV
jgi:hypothetical protein